MDMIDEDEDGNPQLKIPFTCMEIQNDPIEGVFNYGDFNSSMRNYNSYKDRVVKDGGEIINELKTQITMASINGVDRKAVEEVIRIRKNTYISCWVEGNEESLPMWNMYSGKQGFLITVNKEELIKQLSSSVESDNVNYERKNVEPNKVPFVKNEYYKYENEFRFLIRDNSCSSNVIFKRIDRGDDLNLKIKPHPRMEDWIERSYKEIIENAGLSCVKSDFYDDFQTLKRLLSELS